MRASRVAMAVAALLALRQNAAGQAPSAAAAGASAEAPAKRQSCALASEAPAPPSNRQCLGCHGVSGAGPAVSHSHPVDADYAEAHRRGVSLRPMAEVVARGLRLPGGRLQCVTCHDARSPWAMWIALPAGAVARPAKVARGEDAPTWRLPSSGARPELPRGTEVSSAPLCAACHPFAD